jgi:predicted Na+-dependent transporter
MLHYGGICVPTVSSVNGFLRRHFVHAISLFALCAFFTPECSRVIRSQRFGFGQLDASSISLFLMMISAAIQCTVGALRGIVERPKALLVCLTQYFLVLPLGCWLVGHLCVPLLGRAVGEPIQVGLDLVILMPVAATSSVWVRDTKGDLELLVSLVVLTMSLGTLSAPIYLYEMTGLATNSIVIAPWVILRQLIIGVVVPLAIGLVLNRVLRPWIARVIPYFSLLGTAGLFAAVYLNVGTAAPLVKHLPLQQVATAVLIVLAVNMANFLLGSIVGRIAGLPPASQVTCEFSSGMRSNGTALVVGLASFPSAPLVTVPAAIYIIFQHLLASVVKSRLLARYGDSELRPARLSDSVQPQVGRVLGLVRGIRRSLWPA